MNRKIKKFLVEQVEQETGLVGVWKKKKTQDFCDPTSAS